MPNRSSKEWFSIISTTMFSMPGRRSVPGGRVGSKREPGARKIRRPKACNAAGALGPGGAWSQPAVLPKTAGLDGPEHLAAEVGVVLLEPGLHQPAPGQAVQG